MSFQATHLIGFGARRASAAAAVWGTVRSDTVTTGDNTNNFTIRQVYTAAGLTVPPNTITKVRVRFYAPPTIDTLAIGAAYIGHKSGTYGFTSPVQLTFDTGNSASGTISAGSYKLSDEVSFVWDKTSDIVISFHNSSGKTGYVASASNTSNYVKSGNDASNTSPTGYSSGGGAIDGVGLIEMTGF